MKENVRFYRCSTCGNMVGLIHGSMEHITCCGHQMEQMKANSVDAAQEKHVPVYERDGEEIIVKVGEILHPMEEEHSIAWVALVSEDKTTRIALKPGEEPIVRFQYVPYATIYAYCNKHGLWKQEID